LAERVVKVRLSAEIASYQKGMEEAARATRAVGTENEKLAQKKEAFEIIGRSALVAGTAITAVTALSVKAAMDWQSAWAGVTKTVEGTPEELAAVEQGLRDLTGVLPASHDQIAAVAEAAGQLGIQTENVVSFTRTMIDLGETTNLSANDAATAIARFTNIMGTSQSQVSNLGSAIVGLGNNYATTEAEILEMSLRLAGAGKQVGLSEGEVLGLATALSSVGIEAEAGGSAVSKVMIDIAASVDEGGERVELFAKTAGMSADEFANKWRTDPAAALSAFVKGLSNAEAQGSSTLGVLAELGITEVRMRDALLRSSAAADMFSGAMARGNQEFEDNNALTLEAAKRYETVESRIAIAGNAIRDAAIDFGDVFLPAVGAAADAVREFAGFMGDLPEPVQGIIGVLTGLVQFKIAMETLGVSMGRFALIGGGVTLALTAIVTAIGLVVAAQAEANQKAKAYADTFEAGSARITQASRDMAKEALAAKNGFLWMEQDSAYDAAERLGISLDLVTDAALRVPGAMEKLQRQIDEGTDGSLEYANAAVTIERAVRGEADAVSRAADQTAQKAAADKEAAGSSSSVADAYQETAEQAADLSSELAKLIDTINQANGVGQDAISANARWQESLAGLGRQVEDNGTSLDENSAAGSKNAAMLAELAGAAQTAAQAQYEQDQQTMAGDEAARKYSETLAAQRQKFEESAVAAGFNAEQVKALADRVFALPSEKEIAILAETAAAQQGIDTFISLNSGKQIPLRITAQGISEIRLPNGMTASSYSTGGAVYGPGTGTSDSVDARLSNGEHVLTAAEVALMGGQAGVYAFRDSLKKQGKYVASGGSGGGSPTVAPLSLDGVAITGTLSIGGDGLARIIDGRIVQADAASERVLRQGVRPW
jgi:TP901 family phage tail tape measure protein